jgi:pimeloyl-ACP methyl ester carboxylesterase
MDRAELEGITLEYELRGEGEPIVLMHAGVCADFFKPLADEPALAEAYRVLRYHRVGYAGSSPIAGPAGIAEQAAHCRLLMQQLGIPRAHVVGHSSSAMIALQLALDFPDTVHTLALLESARPAPATDLQQEFVRTVAQPTVQAFAAGDAATAVDTWMRGVCGPDYAPALERALPGAFDQAVADAETFVAHELPAVRAWVFTPEDASRITQPALVVLGERSNPVFDERRELLLEWLPDPEPFVLAGATHLLHVENPRGLAEALVAFCTRHPL